MTEAAEFVAGLTRALSNVQNDTMRARALLDALRNSAAEIPNGRIRGISWGRRRGEIDSGCVRIDQALRELAAVVESDLLRLREAER